MAVDTALKRGSATDVLLTYRGWAYPGTAGITAGERQAITYSYGSAAVVAVGKTWQKRNRDVMFILMDEETRWL